MGYQKFGHLSLKECCDCIFEHLLPARKPAEILRKLTDILKTDERKRRFMVFFNSFIYICYYIAFYLQEVLDRPTPKLGLEFDKDRDYKPILEKNDILLPSMYTVTIERIKMSKLVEERKRILEMQKNQSADSVNKKSTIKRKASTCLKERLGGFDLNEIMRESVTSNDAFVKTATSAANTKSNVNTVKNNSNPAKESPLIPSPIIMTDDINKIFHNSTNSVPNVGSQMVMPPNLPFSLPPNFQGTIMIQPTIHVHSNGKYIKNEITKYRQIMPKGGVIQQSKKRKK